MTRIIYEMQEHRCFLEDRLYPSYGIVAYRHTDTGSPPSIIASVDDITSDRERLSRLIESCNRLCLSPIHLEDVIEDFLIS